VGQVNTSENFPLASVTALAGPPSVVPSCVAVVPVVQALTVAPTMGVLPDRTVPVMVGGVTTPPLLDDEPLEDELPLLEDDDPPDELLEEVVPPPEDELLDDVVPPDELLLEEDEELPEDELLLDEDEPPDDELLLDEDPLGGGEPPPPPPPPHAARVSVEMTVSDVNRALSCTGTLVNSLTK
jgi:hypothetical protein